MECTKCGYGPTTIYFGGVCAKCRLELKADELPEEWVSVVHDEQAFNHKQVVARDADANYRLTASKISGDTKHYRWGVRVRGKFNHGDMLDKNDEPMVGHTIWQTVYSGTCANREEAQAAAEKAYSNLLVAV